jgi:hypothetical protein
VGSYPALGHVEKETFLAFLNSNLSVFDNKTISRVDNGKHHTQIQVVGLLA